MHPPINKVYTLHNVPFQTMQLSYKRKFHTTQLYKLFKVSKLRGPPSILIYKVTYVPENKLSTTLLRHPLIMMYLVVSKWNFQSGHLWLIVSTTMTWLTFLASLLLSAAWCGCGLIAAPLLTAPLCDRSSSLPLWNKTATKT